MLQVALMFLSSYDCIQLAYILIVTSRLVRNIDQVKTLKIFGMILEIFYIFYLSVYNIFYSCYISKDNLTHHLQYSHFQNLNFDNY